MALSANTIASSILGASPYVGSQVVPRIAHAIGSAIVQWVSVPVNVIVMGATTGMAGVGMVTGTLQFVIAGQMQAAFVAYGIVGQTAPGIAQMIESGLGTGLASAQYTGSSIGVGVGTDTSKVSFANQASLLPILLTALKGQSVGGATVNQFAAALSQGIAQIIQTGVGFGPVTGPAGNIPAVGTSNSVIF